MKVLKEEFKTVNIKKASVEVELLDGSKGTITRYGNYNPLAFTQLFDFSHDPEALLGYYLDSQKNVYKLDGGVRVPIYNIKKISKISVEDYERTWKLTKYRDWNGFPFYFSSWNAEEVK